MSYIRSPQHPKMLGRKAAGRSILSGRLCAAVAALAMLSTTGTALAQAPTLPLAQTLSMRPIRMSDGWRQHVLHVPGPYVYPRTVSIEGSEGAVSNIQKLSADPHAGVRLSTKRAEGVRIIVDLGIPASGFVEIGVKYVHGAPLRLSYSEDRKLLGKFGDGSNNPEDFFYHGRTLGTDGEPFGRADVFGETDIAKTYVSPGLRGSQRYIAITLDGPGAAVIDYVRVRQTNRRADYAGYFLSSDEVLNKAWYGSALALELATIRDTRRNPDARWVVVDGAKRDRTVYGANMQISGLTGYYLDPAYRDIVKDTLNLFSCQQYPDGTFPPFSLIDVPCKPDMLKTPSGPPKGFEPPAEGQLARLDGYSAWWVIDLADYVYYTGDTDFPRPMMPVARRIVEYFDRHADADGLFVAGDYDGKLAFDWHPPDRLKGKNALLNVVYVETLRSLARLSRSVEQDEKAAQALDARAEKVRNALLGRFWDTGAQALLGNLDDPKRDHLADANIVALLFGLLDKEKSEQSLAFLRTKLRTRYGTSNSEYADNPLITQYISPWLNSQEASARFAHGDASGALSIIRGLWGRMIEYGPGTPWEEMSINGTPKIPRPGTSITDGNTVSRAHPWSSVIPPLSQYVLGVRPTSMAFKTWIVAPQPGDLVWAQGSVPTPQGEIAVAWAYDRAKSSFVLTAVAPGETSGDVVIPLFGRDRSIYMDGKLAWQDGQGAPGYQASRTTDGVIFRQVEGVHTFAWSG